MLDARFHRLALLAGDATLAALARTRVLVVGVGGVGSWCAEALARSGVGAVGLVDSDAVCVTNINRQAQAFSNSIGEAKVDALARILRAINPAITLQTHNAVFSEETAAAFDLAAYDFVIDAIDSLSCKVALIVKASEAGTRLYSSMGMAQKLAPERLTTASIWETRGCPLARLVRHALRKRGFVGDCTVVYSDEHLPRHPSSGLPGCGSGVCLCPRRSEGDASPDWCAQKKVINGSAVTVTATAGMLLASLVLRAVHAQCDAAQSAMPSVEAQPVLAGSLDGAVDE